MITFIQAFFWAWLFAEILISTVIWVRSGYKGKLGGLINCFFQTMALSVIGGIVIGAIALICTVVITVVLALALPFIIAFLALLLIIAITLGGPLSALILSFFL